MLILTRRPVESIYIGDEVTVTVLGVVGNQVRFGIEAPRHIVIDRAEIAERKRRAASGQGAPIDDERRHGHSDERQPHVASAPAGASGAHTRIETGLEARASDETGADAAERTAAALKTNR